MTRVKITAQTINLQSKKIFYLYEDQDHAPHAPIELPRVLSGVNRTTKS